MARSGSILAGGCSGSSIEPKQLERAERARRGLRTGARSFAQAGLDIESVQACRTALVAAQSSPTGAPPGRVRIPSARASRCASRRPLTGAARCRFQWLGPWSRPVRDMLRYAQRRSRLADTGLDSDAPHSLFRRRRGSPVKTFAPAGATGAARRGSAARHARSPACDVGLRCAPRARKPTIRRDLRSPVLRTLSG